MFLASFGGKTVMDAAEAHNVLSASGKPLPNGFEKANRLLNPLGQEPARGWILLRRADLNVINLNALQPMEWAFQWENGSTDSLSFSNLVITKEPVNLSPSYIANDPLAIYLVEISDRRWLCQNTAFTVSINAQYNVLAPSYVNATTGPAQYYAGSLNSGSLWTWATLLNNLWDNFTPILGGFPGIPLTPDGAPTGYVFQGVSAWQALCQVLEKIGCTVAWNPFVTTGQYSIVQVGASDASFTAMQATAIKQNRKIHDGEYLPVIYGMQPAMVRVFFHRQEQGGTETTTPTTTSQWQTQSANSVDVSNADAALAAPGTIHPLWDDLPALYDATGALTNSAALSSRATTRANDFYRLLRTTGGMRLWRRFSGLIAFAPSSLLKGIAWIGDENGVYSEIVNHPILGLKIDAQTGTWRDRFEDATPLHAPDFRPTWPIYPIVSQVLEVVTAAPNADGTYNCKLDKPQAGLTWLAGESVWGQNFSGTPTLSIGERHNCRLVGYYNGRPLYTFEAQTISVTDGTTTVSPVTSVKFIGATVAAGPNPGEADVTIAGSSSGSTSSVTFSGPTTTISSPTITVGGSGSSTLLLDTATIELTQPTYNYVLIAGLSAATINYPASLIQNFAGLVNFTGGIQINGYTLPGAKCLPKCPVRVYAYLLGAGYTRTGNVITATANGTLAPIDGVTLSVGDRLLCDFGSADSGVYVVTSLGSGTTPFVLTRASDSLDGTMIQAGTVYRVYDGTSTPYKDTEWVISSPIGAINVNTDTIVFQKVGQQIDKATGKTGKMVKWSADNRFDQAVPNTDFLAPSALVIADQTVFGNASGATTQAYALTVAAPLGAILGQLILSYDTSLQVSASKLGLAAIPDQTLLGNASGASAAPQALTVATPLTVTSGSVGFNFDSTLHVSGGQLGVANPGITSVALAMPTSVFTVSGSPITSTGTFNVIFNVQAANTFFAGPSSGVPATPTFRALTVADLPLVGSANGLASLDSGGKVPTSQLPASVVGSVDYQGSWNASTNTPTLASGTGTKGYYYLVGTAGTTTLDGISAWSVNDWTVFDGVKWERLPGSVPVASVFGRTGAVVAAIGDYTAAQVTNAVDSTVTYGNPAWITAISLGKIAAIAAQTLLGNGAVVGTAVPEAVALNSSNLKISSVSGTDTFDLTNVLGASAGTYVVGANKITFDTYGRCTAIAAYPSGTGPLAATPTGLTATAGNAQVTVGYAISTGTSSLNLYYGLASTGPWTFARNVSSGTSTIISPLANGQLYYFTAASLTSGGSESALATAVSATPGGSASSVPASLTATAGNASVLVSWSTTSGASTYNPYYATANTGPWTKFGPGVSGLSTTVTGLTNGTQYYFVVTGVASGGTESAYQTPVSATPLASLPTTPTMNSPTVTSGSVTLTWTTVTGATYKLFRSITSGGYNYASPLTSPTGTSYTDATVTNGTTYYYTVEAVISGNSSTPSNEIIASPVAAPSAPTSLSASPGHGSVSLTWTAPAGAVTAYKIYRSTTTGTETLYASPSGTGTSYTDNTVTNGQIYYYKVAAVNSGGTGTLSTEASATPTSILPASELLYWKLDTGSGTTATDSTSNSNSGTLSGAPTWSTTVPSVHVFDNYSVLLNGTSQCISNTLLSSYTNGATKGAFSIWTKLSNLTQNATIIGSSSGTSTNSYIRLDFLGGSSQILQAQIVSSGTVRVTLQSAANAINDTNWHHLVLQSDASTVTVWLDGSQVTMTATAGTNTGQWFASAASSSSVFIVGAISLSPVANYLAGYVDEVRYYNANLTNTQISNLASGYNEDGST